MCLNLSPLLVSYKPQVGQGKIPVALRVWRVDESTFRPGFFNGHNESS
jgi:hypothetical protein